MERTDQEIVEQTEQLARAFAEADHLLFRTGTLYRESKDPRLQHYWRMACIAQCHLTQTDPEDALTNMETDEESPPPVPHESAQL